MSNYYNTETLIEQQAEVEALKAERDALAAQVEALLGRIKKAKDELSCCNFNSAGERLAHLLEISPQHHLREVRADAVLDAVKFFTPALDIETESLEWYADKIRRGEVE